jgi:hypothetical protein
MMPAIAGENSELNNPYLYPPLNFVVESVETTPYLTWQKPELPNGQTPPGLTGFRICRNGMNIKTFNSTDTLYWYDWPLDWVNGLYYTINAIYDLTYYGQPGQTGYSLQAGPDTLDLPYWLPLPFYEDWNQGTFAFYDWKFQPSQGNWMINSSSGNPTPSACFTGSPVVTNYSYSIICPLSDAIPYPCSDAFLEFDYKLSQVQPSASDFLSVEINRGGDLWETVEEYVNSENTSWIHKHIQLPDAGGMLFKIRFRAHGGNSGTIDAWCLDNISVYVVCRAPGLSGSSGNNAVSLTWTPPDCGGTGLTNWWNYDDGSAETYYGGDAFQDRWFGNQFLVGSTGPVKVNEINAYFGYTPDHGTDLAVFEIFNEDRIHIATSQPFIPPDDGWISISKEFMIPQQGSIFVMVHYMGPVHVSNPVGYDTNGSVTSDELAWVYDGTSWMKATTACGAPVGCFLIRLNATIETDSPVIIPPSSAPDFINTTAENALQGYNIYRSDLSGSGPYVKLNASLCVDTIYVDNIPPGIEGRYCYYVTSVIGTIGSLTCESSGDTICFDIPIGLNKIPDHHVNIYPNPVIDKLTIESGWNIDKISLIDCFGQIMIEKNRISGKRIIIAFSDLPQGIYMLNMVCNGEVIARKIVKQ